MEMGDGDDQVTTRVTTLAPSVLVASQSTHIYQGTFSALTSHSDQLGRPARPLMRLKPAKKRKIIQFIQRVLAIP